MKTQIVKAVYVTILVMIFAGITFPISVLPAWMQTIALLMPQTYIIHGLRTALLSDAVLADLAPDLLALFSFGALWLSIGYWAFNRMERRARRTGALGQY